ncbi:hypothetical protein QYE76_035593 [Lolium multiflorum]|uniref:Uncharacterized protein n=1 Tax=Lolium multiflorum TaxID=4521 RepID=A0AAD8R0R5_LOLMU|nr:hypothetical protein QYE76_035593 [Lolium multiflorum]
MAVFSSLCFIVGSCELPNMIKFIYLFHVGAGIPGVAPHYISPPSTFNVLLGSYWFDKPWFLTEENLPLYASHLPLGVLNGRVLYAYQELKKLKGELAAMRLAPGRVGPDHLEIKVVERIVELQHREEMMWRQRSQIQWLAEGGRNTLFFHIRASKRKKRNRISRLRRQDGSFTEDPDELRHLAREFYDTLYTSEQTAGVEEVLDAVHVSVTQAMNDQLLVPFEGGEVKAALFQMFPLKAPGPDGFPAHFFQKHWDLCGEEVTKAVLRILSGEDSPEGINKTFIEKELSAAEICRGNSLPEGEIVAIITVIELDFIGIIIIIIIISTIDTVISTAAPHLPSPPPNSSSAVLEPAGRSPELERHRELFVQFVVFLSPASHRSKNLTAGDSDHRGLHSGKSFELHLLAVLGRDD